MTVQAATARRTGALAVLWRFSRPHTLIGTFSIGLCEGRSTAQISA